MSEPSATTGARVPRRVTEYLNPRVARIVALPAPTDRQRGQWYFQRYVEQLPGRARSS
jgi:polyphosphate kinase 2 (PPK2 family)